MGKLGEEAIEEIRQDYQETGSIEKTAQNVGRAKDTVQKYTADFREKDDDMVDETDAMDDSDWTGTPPSETPFSSSNRSPLGKGSERVDLSSMTAGEFIDYFFDELEMGVKSDFARMLSKMADLRGEIPDGDQLSLLIQQHGSGIGNANDANMIAEIYDDMAEKYLSEKGMGNAGPSAFGRNGQWQSPHQNGQQGASDGGVMPQNPNAGSWSSVPSEHQPGQVANPQRPPGMQGHHPGQQGPAQGGQNQMFQMMERMMDQMQQQQREMMERFEELSRDRSEKEETGEKSMIEQMNEIVEMRSLMEQLDGGQKEEDQMQRMVQQFNQQLQALGEQMNSRDSGMSASSGDPRTDALVKMATDQNMDIERLEMLSDVLGMESDPEIKKAEIEKEIQESKSKRRQEMLEEGISALGEVANDLVESGLDTVVGPGNVQEPTDDRTRAGRQVRKRPENRAAEPKPEREPEVHEEPQTSGSPMREKYGGSAPADDVEVVEESAYEEPGTAHEPTERDPPAEEPAEPDPFDIGYALNEEMGYKTTDYGKFVSDMTNQGVGRDTATEVWSEMREDGLIEKGTRTAESDTEEAANGGVDE